MIKYDAELDVFTYETGGIVFIWDEEPTDSFEYEVQNIVKSYYINILNIIKFMLPDIQAMYGDVDIDKVKKNLGRVTIDIQNGQVSYCEQTFDDVHIFSFEFLQDDFSELQYFSIDG